MPIPLHHFLIFTSILFFTGLYGTLTRRNIVGILMSIEIMLNAVNINFVVFASQSDGAEWGQIFVIFIVVLAAASAAVGLAIVLAIYRNQKTIYADEINILKW